MNYGIQDGVGIRRLTPLECERLQGFLDEWTRWALIDGKKVEVSDSQRYKCLGNAVTVNVVRAIGAKMCEANLAAEAEPLEMVK